MGFLRWHLGTDSFLGAMLMSGKYNRHKRKGSNCSKRMMTQRQKQRRSRARSWQMDVLIKRYAAKEEARQQRKEVYTEKEAAIC
ncbi:hypothetical protein NVP2117O_77 [Vibrio phage 2.117.O._10N.261.45.E9]|nr:hypothetical protein NVP1117O_77 [Vibrio phage 1.117.O._10N.261.45.E9]AUR95478.1 hypothetical protein NVP1207B_71 [Vibrio phage 1.207.B._10N.222.51.C2]AUS02369.1 hypothetical protein NVP2117O_77 [Vibrio phage 2.117.O._10N.261.45.E9]